VAENSEIAVYLDHLIKNFSAEVKGLQDVVSRNPDRDLTDSVRNVCLASRSAYSEFLALHIDGAAGLEQPLEQLYALHLDALAALEKLANPAGHVLEFIASIEQRRDELNAIRRYSLAGSFSGTSR
jgi:hypothetical protein